MAICYEVNPERFRLYFGFAGSLTRGAHMAEQTGTLFSRSNRAHMLASPERAHAAGLLCANMFSIRSPADAEMTDPARMPILAALSMAGG